MLVFALDDEVFLVNIVCLLTRSIFLGDTRESVFFFLLIFFSPQPECVSFTFGIEIMKFFYRPLRSISLVLVPSVVCPLFHRLFVLLLVFGLLRRLPVFALFMPS